ncbi:hypothetical protein C2G38_2157262 [Gigaspora rosea]|uniref:Uncharacterized protein n=1 Tax=Gigaspora rosea TaxID=44941 RepID=A0A397W3R4_9GLOM|nr:hypothetical protein C2G38_2157262 [Gigaspora rosea]
MPEFKIEFIYNNNTEIVISNKSASNATNLYIQRYHELASIDIEQKLSTSKRREDPGNSMQLKHSKNFGNQLLNLFEQQASQALNEDDNGSLEGLIFLVEMISNLEIIQEATNSIGKATYQSIRDILAYIIPVWAQSKTCYGDFTLLNDTVNLYNSNYHFTLLLYPDIEICDILKIALTPLITDLNNLANGYIDKDSWKWQIQLYFSAGWKFLALCMGTKQQIRIIFVFGV